MVLKDVYIGKAGDLHAVMCDVEIHGNVENIELCEPTDNTRCLINLLVTYMNDTETLQADIQAKKLELLEVV